MVDNDVCGKREKRELASGSECVLIGFSDSSALRPMESGEDYELLRDPVAVICCSRQGRDELRNKHQSVLYLLSLNLESRVVIKKSSSFADALSGS